MALAPKHAAFVREYLVDLNATQAAVRAGYSPKSAKVQGSRLLTNADIRTAIDGAQRKTEERGVVTREEILQELRLLAFADIGGLVDEKGYFRSLNEIPPELRRCIASVDLTGDGGTKVKLCSKDRALELLGKHLALWTDKTELTGKDGEALTVSIAINGVKK